METPTRPERDARVLVVDDHPALRAGLTAVLDAEPGISLLPPVQGSSQALELAASGSPDAAVVDVVLGADDGLELCLDLKSLANAPAVVLYTAVTDAAMAVKARLVGAEGLVTKGSPVAELTRALKNALAGDPFVPRADPEVVSRLDGRVSEQDLAILGLRLELIPVGEIAEVLALSPEQVRARILRLVVALGEGAGGVGGSLSAGARVLE